MASGSGLSELSSALCDRLIDTGENQEQTGSIFLPIHEFDQFVGRDVINQALQNEGFSAADATALEHRIHDPNRPATRLCLTLLRFEKIDGWKQLLNCGIVDSSLPLTLKTSKGPFVDRDGVQVPHGFFSTWKRVELEGFRDNQFQFLAPKLESGTFVYDIHPRVPLPIIKMEETQEFTFSKVTKVKVPPSHLSGLLPGDDESFALKQLEYSNKDFDKTAQDNEQKNLEFIHRLNHIHLIKPTAVFKKKNSLSFLFPWAETGTLEDVWSTEDLAFPFTESRDAKFVWMMQQMTYVSSALSLLANKGCRHSDLKPGNLLCFVDGSNAVIKITDVGISRVHVEATELRQTGTDTKLYTRRYTPPEFAVREASRSNLPPPQKRQSRRYDVWCLGCILVEFMTWVQDGPRGFKTFYENTKATPFAHGDTVHPSVTNQLNRLKEAEVVREVRDLLDYIKNKMLVRLDDRDTAVDVWQTFDAICNKLDIPLDSESSRAPPEESGTSNLAPPKPTPPKPSPPKPSRSVATSTPTSNAPTTGASSSTTAGNFPDTAAASERINTIQDFWTAVPDNDVARTFFDSLERKYPPNDNTTLCTVCSALKIWQREFVFSRQVGELNSSWSCHLCKVFSAAATALALPRTEQLRCNWEDSNLRVSGPTNGPSVNLAVFLDPSTLDDHELPALLALLPSAQIGHPIPQPSNNPHQYELLKHLLRVCNEKHEGCKRNMSEKRPPEMPTRLIYVGESDSEIRLETSPPSNEHYAALSHRWSGNNDLLTSTTNIDELQKTIPFDRLKKNFQDAVCVTRALGLSYLWIDTLCIIQFGDEKDWEYEAARMSHVFGNAYFTIASSSDASSELGFLKRQQPPPVFATLLGPKDIKIHVSELLEDFHRDVETAPLSTRGWVYQERALARRTLHFTGTQVYWECSNGVNSERLFKLTNPRAGLLGDSNFPRTVLQYHKGGRQKCFKDLYKQYSALDLSKITDRSRAILGLEQRLKDTLGSRGAFGILQVYFQRSLLWQRLPPHHLKRIDYSKGQVPSWSWMACEGAIDYMEIPTGTVDWTFESDKLFGTASEPEPVPPRTFMTVLGKKLVPDQREYGDRIRFDEAGRLSDEDLRCVVLGIGKEADGNGDKIHYVLVITKNPDKAGSWRRVGAAWLLGRHLGPDEKEVLLA